MSKDKMDDLAVSVLISTALVALREVAVAAAEMGKVTTPDEAEAWVEAAAAVAVAITAAELAEEKLAAVTAAAIDAVARTM